MNINRKLWGFSATIIRGVWSCHQCVGLQASEILMSNMLISFSGWWLSSTHLKNDGVSNSWDDDIPNWMENHKSHVPNHQAVLDWIGRSGSNDPNRYLWVFASTTTTPVDCSRLRIGSRQQNRRNSLMMLMLTINVLMHLEKVNWQVKCIKVSEYKHSSWIKLN